MSKKDKEIKKEENEVENQTIDETNVDTKENPIKEEKKDEVSETDLLKKEVLDLKDKNLRLLAEFENYKRRTQKEKSSTYDFALKDAILNVIPILDTLEISLNNDATDGNAFKVGIELVVKKFKETLDKMGVKPIESVGTQFDPEFHNAVLSVCEGDCESGAIVEELQKGYILNEKVIRHSMVKVKN